MNRDERVAQLEGKLTLTSQVERIWAKGAFQELPIYRAPTDILYLNYDNRRFRAEAQRAAIELGHPLDSTSSVDDEGSIISLLLDREPMVDGPRVTGKPSKETRALLTDWLTRGQERPFWIRPDGLVVNGNRRLAMIKREQASRGLDFCSWVQVIVFSEDEYDDDVLFDLEAREQLTEGLKVRYSDINILLTLRDAAKSHGIIWRDPASIKRVAGLIQYLVNNDPAYAEVQLNAIKYMDLYLEDIGAPEKYYRLQGMVERFREVGRIMSWIATEDSSREDAMLNMLIAGLMVGSTHLDLRDVRTLLKRDPEEFDRTIGYVRQLEEEVQPEPADEEEVVPDGGDEDEDDGDDEDEDEEDEIADPSLVSIPSAPSYPKPAVKRAIDTAVQGVRDAKRNDKRAQVLSAAKRLTAITPNDLAPHLGSNIEGDRLRDAIQTIVAWADTMHELTDAQPADDPG